MDIQEFIGTRFRQARNFANITSDAAAQALGVTRPAISQLENGKRVQVRPDFILNASLLYRVSPSYLVGATMSTYWEIGWNLYLTGQFEEPLLRRYDEVGQEMCVELGIDAEEFRKRLELPTVRSLTLEETMALVQGVTKPI